MYTLYRYQGHVSAALVLGGVDVTGPHLYSVYPHGSTDSLPYATMGSGSLAAMAVFEAKYKEDMEVYYFVVVLDDESPLVCWFIKHVFFVYVVFPGKRCHRFGK